MPEAQGHTRRDERGYPREKIKQMLQFLAVEIAHHH
jgi:hypothetical protein